jgi:hypothetical protein
MRTHSSDAEESALRPKAARLDPAVSPPMARAAATGHPEVLDPQTVLGLQRAVGNAGVGAALTEERSPVHDVIGSGGGSPLAPDVLREMQTRLGHDFSDVRVHTDSRASDSARAVNAHAYTVGSNVVFQRDAYDPTSTAGKTMLAHELTHVVQQRSGPVDGTSTGGGIKVSDPGDRFEREAAATAERAMSAPLAASTPSAAGGAAVQRAEDEEEDTAQGSFVQRHEDSAAQDSLQGMFVQRAEDEEEDTAQGSFVQRDEAPEEEEAG